MEFIGESVSTSERDDEMMLRYSFKAMDSAVNAADSVVGGTVDSLILAMAPYEQNPVHEHRLDTFSTAVTLAITETLATDPGDIKDLWPDEQITAAQLTEPVSNEQFAVFA